MSRQFFSQNEKDAIYRVIRERRDVRRFKKDPIPEEVLNRILSAAMQAPSVGYMQPSNFILVEDMEVRQKVHQSFLKANEEAKALFPGERGEKYASLKLEGLLECPLNICVTCDRVRFGAIGLGRTCQPEMDLYSTVCAVQNLWLAARSEGVGVGWVSIIKPEDLPSILGLPEKVVPVAYLCVGYTEQFALEPELKTAGWNPEMSAHELVFWNQWGKKSR